MKKITLLSVFVLMGTIVSAQAVWNKKIPIISTLNSFAKLSSNDDSYWVSSDKSLFQFNELGDITGRITTDIGFTNFWFWGGKVTPSNNASPYYILARPTSITPGSGYTLAHYSPNSGILNETVFTDSLSSITQTRGPVVVTVDNSTLFVFGHKVIRSIQHSENGSITETWAKPLSFRTTDAFWRGSQAIFCDASGNFKSMDADGNLLWEKTHPFSTKSIKKLPDGLIGCGNAASGEGLVFKMDFNGDLLWSQILPETKLNDLTLVSDGGIFLTGETETLTWMVLKTDGLGNPLWTRSYETGKGWEIEPTTDGGAVVLWHNTIGGFRLHLAKIDAFGNTAPAETEISQITERTLHTSGAKTTQFPLTGLFFDGFNSRLNIPADSATSTIFVHSPWIGGLNETNALHIAATTYGNAQQDFRAGLASSPARDFNRVWAVSREEIAQIRLDFGEDGDLDTPPPFDLLTWPAKGNPHFRQNLDFSLVTTHPDSLPAPFIDVNGDGIYNVFDGDYPRLLGDRMLWWVRTDQTTHVESFGQPLGVDVLITLYGYDCPQNGAVSNALFVEYQFINRSGEEYHDTYLGFYTDFDLGCSDDDYTGSLPALNSAFVYNQDAVDGNPGSICSAGVATFGEKVPVQALSLLNHTLDHSISWGGNSGASDPSSPIQYYAYLQGLICQGQLPTIGGTGCNPGSTDFTHFLFPDNPADPQGWSMCSENLSLADRRMLNSHGPFDFAAGDTFTMRLAFTYHPDVPHPCPDIDTWVKPNILQIQQWHDDGTLDARLDLGGVLTLTQGQPLVLDATQTNPATTYIWSSGQTTASISVTQPGTYTVSVTPATGCSYTETVLVQLASSTHSPTLPRWTVQPNPASERLTILAGNTEGPLKVLLRNAQGQTVAMQNGTGNALEISVVNLPAGLYFAELWQEGQFLGSRKVVIQK
jgi:hypothetical protein